MKTENYGVNRPCSWCGKKSAFTYTWGNMGEFDLCLGCAKNIASNVINDILK